jgi:hypothetical protein
VCVEWLKKRWDERWMPIDDVIRIEVSFNTNDGWRGSRSRCSNLKIFGFVGFIVHRYDPHPLLYR